MAFLLKYAPLVAGVYLVWLVSIMSTKDLKSATLFKTIPAIIAMLLLLPFAIEAVR